MRISRKLGRGVSLVPVEGFPWGVCSALKIVHVWPAVGILPFKKKLDSDRFYGCKVEYKPGGGPTVTSHGELMLCDVPMFPPSLSLPCLPLPATVMTVPFSRLI